MRVSKINFITLSLVLILCDAKAVDTNVNQVTDFFDKEIEDKNGDKKSLENVLDNARNQAIEGINNKEIIKNLEISEEALEKKSSELDSIDPHHLETAGSVEKSKESNSYYGVLEVDYSDPQNLAHKKDTDFIADKGRALIQRLEEGLKEIGVDCKSVEGRQEIEPQYHIDIKKEKENDKGTDTSYNRTICEELRNHYHCRDVLTLTCARRGPRYGPWQDKDISFEGRMLYYEHHSWGWEVNPERRIVRWKIHKYQPKRRTWFQTIEPDPKVINDEVRQFIIRTLRLREEQVHEIIDFPPDGEGIGHLISLEYGYRTVWSHYLFKYKYRDFVVDGVCEEWREDWTEVCGFK